MISTLLHAYFNIFKMDDTKTFRKEDKNMESYSAFASVYDVLMQDVDYFAWASYIEKIFERYEWKPQNIADIACGTGSITNILAQRGYNLIGVDISEDMLFVAREKAEDMNLDVIYLQQDMKELILPTELDAILCVCDGVNYITREDELILFFQSVYRHLKQKGLFIFDISSWYKLSTILANNTYAENYEDVSYIWENYFDAERCICDFDLTLFIKEGDRYKKYQESHSQRAYHESEILNCLHAANFTKKESFEAFTFQAPSYDSERICFVCQKT